tara:strand:+ start:55 stop:222 length:168 start_codon:yes stop_codon:yes gene_type:complete
MANSPTYLRQNHKDGSSVHFLAQDDTKAARQPNDHRFELKPYGPSRAINAPIVAA